MGGIGKFSLLGNVREKSKNGLAELRHKFLSDLLEEDDHFIDTSTTFVESRLSRMKVFVVLDDISTLEQLENLVGDFHCFGPGSRILITTRDKHVLSKGVDKICTVQELKPHQSLELFNLNAFNNGLSTMEYEELTKKALVYAKGIPLA
ncbi:TMV resistance protein N-like [Prosopis cineraria]|uniref:TMV resistance protein N-like n=1 Tax=Prosopis cineraria TaxID=364024 RepID=UPI0024101BDD|nr:TMV resistance protein N-like [Prosopis cineraria]